MKQKHFIFLYSELAQYFLSCVKVLAGKEDVKVSVIHWPVNPEAPFDFNYPENVSFYSRDEFTEETLLTFLESENPNVIITSGWIDKTYLKAAGYFRKKGITTVITLDNQWKGSMKQLLATVVSPFAIKNKFDFVWVPGEPQQKYARKLGFSPEKILTGFYSADVNYFEDLYLNFKDEKVSNFPHKIIYVGRYTAHKGIFEMWEAFQEIKKETPNDWELWCLGTGDKYEDRIKAEGLKHFGFIQPQDMKRFIKQTGVFILPSHFEPWGVALHEFAAAGYPIICSDEVGAATAFLKEGENGYIFKAGNKINLKNQINRIILHSDAELSDMGVKSTELAKLVTPEKWADAIYKTVEEKCVG